VGQTVTRPQIEESAHPFTEEMRAEQMSSAELNAKAVDQMRLFWNERGLLAKAFLVGILVGLVTALLIPPRYEASVQLMPPDTQSSTGMAMLAALTAKAGNSNLGGIAGDLLGIKSSGGLFVGVLGSRTIQDRLVDRFQLKKVYSYKLEQDARKKLQERTVVSEDRKSGIISITVVDRDPERAAALAEAYVEELNQLVTSLSTSGAHRERVFLEERLQAVKKDLDDAAQKFSEFASKNVAIDIKDQGRAMVEAASRLQGEKIAAESELKGLEEIYTPNNVRIRAVQARIAELQHQLEKLGGGTVASNLPATNSDSMYPSIRELPLLGVTWGDLYMRTRIEGAVYEALTQQYELAKVQEAKETPSVKVLDSARVPEKRSFPPRTLITIFGGCVFLTAACVGLVVRRQWQETDANDPGKLFAQEVIQSVNSHMPWAAPNGSRVRAKTHRVWQWGRNKDAEEKSDSGPESL
jgi:capsule polysaccharide export protein KpsE/RkpR